MTRTEDGYRGRAGATRRERVLWACPCGAKHSVELLVAVDAKADPTLARRAVEGDPTLRQTVCPASGERVTVEAPLVYHDGARGILALVLGEGDRRRELEERAALLTLMASDAAHEVPAYAVEFAVVYGAGGLRALVAEPAAATARPEIEVVEVTQPGGSGPVERGQVERWPGGRDPVVRRVGEGGAVQLLVRAGRAEMDLFADPALDVRIQLHRMPNYPLVTLVFGGPAAMTGRAGAGAPFVVPLDFAADADRAVLAALGKSFELSLEIYNRDAGDALVRRRRVSAPLADNARCAVAGAGDYLKRVPVGERSYGKALASFLAPDYDRLGLGGALAADLDEGALDAYARPADAVRALRVVRRFSEPASEDWLTLLRGYPVERWQARRRAVVERAVELGLWPGAVAATVAVSENLARSRKDLVVRLMRSFAHLLASGGEHGLDEAAVRENRDALRAEAAAIGVPATEWTVPRSEPIVSESEPVASGTIGEVTELLPALEDKGGDGDGDDAPAPAPAAARRAGNGRRSAARAAGMVEHLDDAALLRLLDQRERRMAAAIELARRGSSTLAGPVFAALHAMSRGEAGRVLGSAIGFGRAAEPHLMTLLASRKGFLRQGAALALAVLRGEAGLEAICDLLIDEPTEIWREVARALGESGAAAVMPLVSRLGGKRIEARERVAWALAHIAARGGRKPIETVAGGRDAAAAGVARHALELADAAGTDHRQMRTEPPPRDQTVNRAFSRQFFAAMASDPAAPAMAPVDVSAPAMLLDESDVLESVDLDGEDEAELDERDLIP
jgi:hypothetical protein